MAAPYSLRVGAGWRGSRVPALPGEGGVSARRGRGGGWSRLPRRARARAAKGAPGWAGRRPLPLWRALPPAAAPRAPAASPAHRAAQAAAQAGTLALARASAGPSAPAREDAARGGPGAEQGPRAGPHRP